MSTGMSMVIVTMEDYAILNLPMNYTEIKYVLKKY
jgi:hypothetical protein